MGLFNILTGSHSGGKEQSPVHSEQQHRLSREYVPAVVAELLEADNAIRYTVAANERLPLTHPYLHATTIASPAIQETFRHDEQPKQQPAAPSEEQSRGTYEGKAPYGMIDTAPADIAEAQARVAAAYKLSQAAPSQAASPLTGQDIGGPADV